jgi:hypothetical protein
MLAAHVELHFVPGFKNKEKNKKWLLHFQGAMKKKITRADLT